MIQKAIFGVGVVLLLLLGTIVLRTFLFGAQQTEADQIEDINIDKHATAERLAGALRFKTVSVGGQPATEDEFGKLHAYLEDTYPHIHRELKREIVNSHSLLYTWEGTDAELKPIMLMAHMDVVPVEPGTESRWTHSPFAGVIAADNIWGRGALDMKQSLMAMIEAVEYLLDKGHVPRRTVYLAFGHDEEIGGYKGAAKIADLLEARQVQLEFTLDEGSAIVQGIIPGVKRPAALIGLAEKGFVTLRLTAHGEGGHGSMPPRHTAVGKLARAIHRLESHQMPAEIRRPVSDMFEYLAPEMPFHQRLVIANRWLFNALFIGLLEKSRATNAAVRTTTAITVVESGDAYNILPTEAAAVGTFRILPGDTVDMVVEHVKKIIDDEGITLQRTGAGTSDPSRLSTTNSMGFTSITRSVRQVFPDAVIAPSLVVTGTDSGHYESISENSYRFVPMRVSPEDLKRIHGIDERISIDNYADIIRFYIQLMLQESTMPE